MTALIILLVIIAAIGLYIMSVYNTLVELKNNYLNAFAQIQVQLKRRYDLIPTLVETAKGYMKHEKETLQRVIEARNGASGQLKEARPDNETSMHELGKNETNLTKEMSKFNILVEAYPDLKANENMMQLSEELTTTENKISFARQAYNDAVMEYNTYKQSVPPKFFAASFGHIKDATLLEFEDSEQIQDMPEVKF